MPQFNPEDGNLENHGIPIRLLEYLSVEMDAGALSTLPKLLKQEIANGSVMSHYREPLKINDIICFEALPYYWEMIEDFSKEITRVTGWSPTKGNGPLVQYFRDGEDFTSWNRGTGELLAGHPEAVMASFGTERVLDIRYKKDPSVIFSIKLKSGTALHFKPPLSEEYDIRIPRMKGINDPTICVLYPKGSINQERSP